VSTISSKTTKKVNAKAGTGIQKNKKYSRLATAVANVSKNRRGPSTAKTSNTANAAAPPVSANITTPQPAPQAVAPTTTTSRWHIYNMDIFSSDIVGASTPPLFHRVSGKVPIYVIKELLLIFYHQTFPYNRYLCCTSVFLTAMKTSWMTTY